MLDKNLVDAFPKTSQARLSLSLILCKLDLLVHTAGTGPDSSGFELHRAWDFGLGHTMAFEPRIHRAHHIKINFCATSMYRDWSGMLENWARAFGSLGLCSIGPS